MCFMLISHVRHVNGNIYLDLWKQTMLLSNDGIVNNAEINTIHFEGMISQICPRTVY